MWQHSAQTCVGGVMPKLPVPDQPYIIDIHVGRCISEDSSCEVLQWWMFTCGCGGGGVAGGGGCCAGGVGSLLSPSDEFNLWILMQWNEQYIYTKSTKKMIISFVKFHSHVKNLCPLMLTVLQPAYHWLHFTIDNNTAAVTYMFIQVQSVADDSSMYHAVYCPCEQVARRCLSHSVPALTRYIPLNHYFRGKYKKWEWLAHSGVFNWTAAEDVCNHRETWWKTLLGTAELYSCTGLGLSCSYESWTWQCRLLRVW